MSEICQRERERGGLTLKTHTCNILIQNRSKQNELEKKSSTLVHVHTPMRDSVVIRFQFLFMYVEKKRRKPLYLYNIHGIC